MKSFVCCGDVFVAARLPFSRGLPESQTIQMTKFDARTRQLFGTKKDDNESCGNVSYRWPVSRDRDNKCSTPLLIYNEAMNIPILLEIV